MGIKLNTALGGSITLEPTNTANNVTVNLPVLDNGIIVTANALGNVGIGTDSPSATLDVRSSSNPRILLNNISATSNDTTDVDITTFAGTTPFWSRLNLNGSQVIFKTFNTERMRISADTLVLRGGVTNANGTGITFPATQNSSGNANTLDDYEEGFWTPGIGGNATYVNQLGRYTKIGNKVFIECFVEISSKGTGSGDDIFGLPFITNPAAGPLGTVAVGFYSNSITAFSYLSATIGQNGTAINLRFVAAGGGGGMGAPNFFQNGTAIFLSGHYTVP